MRRGFVSLMAVVDGYRRRALAWWLSNPLTADFCLEAVREAIDRYGQLKRLNQEFKRRTLVVRNFPDAESCPRLVHARAAETHEGWREALRCLNSEHLRERKKEALRAIAASGGPARAAVQNHKPGGTGIAQGASATWPIGTSRHWSFGLFYP